MSGSIVRRKRDIEMINESGKWKVEMACREVERKREVGKKREKEKTGKRTGQRSVQKV